MAKVWFIYVQNRQVGPFTHEEILARFAVGKLKAETPVWRKGLKSWMTIETCSDFMPHISKSPIRDDSQGPDFPELPELPDLPEIPVAQEEQELPDLPVEEEINDVPAVNEEVEAMDLPPIPTEKKSYKLFWKIIFGVVPLAIAAVWIVLITLPTPISLPKDILDATNFSKLYSAAKSDIEGDFKIVPSKDSASFILASNYDGEAQLYLTLESYDKRLLSNMPSKISSKSEYHNHSATFTNLRIVEGEGLVPGLYRVKVQGVKTSPWFKFAKIVRNTHLLDGFKFASNFNDRLNFEGDLLYRVDDLNQLDRMIEDMNDKAEQQRVAPINELIERYRTYDAILTMLKDLFDESIKTFKKPGYVYRFERAYIKKISPLYQAITVENQRIQDAIKKQDDELAKEYEILIDYGKRIGELSSDLNRDFKKFRKLKSKNRLKLLKSYRDLVEEMHRESNAKIDVLQALIN